MAPEKKQWPSHILPLLLHIIHMANTAKVIAFHVKKDSFKEGEQDVRDVEGGLPVWH